MKFDAQKTFPYPVLRPFSDDYQESDFQFTADFNIDTDEIRLDCSFITSCQEIASLVREGKAEYVALVTCRSTYYRDLVRTRDLTVSARYDSNNLKGEVQVYPFIVATQEIKNFTCSDINSEFGANEFNFRAGQPLALDQPCTAYIDRELFKPVTSVFEIVRSESVDDGEWILSFDEDKIQIALSPRTKEIIDEARNEPSNKAILVNSIYFATTMEVIQVLKETDVHHEKRWAKVFEQQFHNLGIKLSEPNYRIATKLMRNPLYLLDTYVFRVGAR